MAYPNKHLSVSAPDAIHRIEIVRTLKLLEGLPFITAATRGQEVLTKRHPPTHLRC